MLQLVYFLICFGVTWIPIAGILFPVLFFLLIAIREHVLPKFFPSEYLKELDAAEYEEIAGVPKVNYFSYLYCTLLCKCKCYRWASVHILVYYFCANCILLNTGCFMVFCAINLSALHTNNRHFLSSHVHLCCIQLQYNLFPGHML